MNIIELANKAAMQTETFVHHGFDGAFLETFARLVIEDFVKGVDVEPVGYADDYSGGFVDSLRHWSDGSSNETKLYTASQMAAQRSKALEEAAMVCEKECDNWDEERPLRVCAKAIRALGVKE